MMPIARATAALLACTALAGLLAPPAPAAGQGRTSGAAREVDDRPPRVLFTAWSAFSIREGQSTLRLADDLIEIGGRLSLHRAAAAVPWVQADYFWRPDLNCPDIGIVCNTEGMVLRAGLTLPLTEDDTRPGVHPRLLGGVGAGFSAETELAWLLAVGAVWSLHPRFAPAFEARWEAVPGLRTVAMLGAGLRVGLF